MNGLVGRFVFWGTDDFCLAGEIIDRVEDGCYLVKQDPAPDNSPMPHRVLPLHMAWEEAFFFDTRAELDAWYVWLDTPSDTSKKPKVVAINGKTAEH